MKVGIIGSGGIGLASASWLSHSGHEVSLWSRQGNSVHELRSTPLRSSGVLESSESVKVVDSLQELAAACPVLLIAVPVNGHRTVMESLVGCLRDGHTVIVSSMSSLSSLYLYEAARMRGIRITVASFGTTVLTARRETPTQVRIMTRRDELGVSALPLAALETVRALCSTLFGGEFPGHANALATALTNINPVAHGPLALFNWTRIERGENWPQYHYLTPCVAAVIERLDAERLALARAFGLEVRTIERHFAKSFGTESGRLADIAAELHQKRGGPPGPTDIATRFLAEDIPFGLVFSLVLGAIAGVPMTATAATVEMASLITSRNFAAENDLTEVLKLRQESVKGLLARLSDVT
jgi:opine dehydrogenase